MDKISGAQLQKGFFVFFYIFENERLLWNRQFVTIWTTSLNENSVEQIVWKHSIYIRTVS